MFLSSVKVTVSEVQYELEPRFEIGFTTGKDRDGELSSSPLMAASRLAKISRRFSACPFFAAFRFSARCMGTIFYEPDSRRRRGTNISLHSSSSY